MAELFLELFSEEIPARMQARASDDLKRLVTDRLKEAGLAFSGASAYATPRRLALTVDGLPLAQPDVTEEKRGPRVGAPDQAVQGFLKSAGLSSLDQCEKRDTGKGEFWFAVLKKKGVKTVALLPALLTESFVALPWPKSMRWAGHQYRWVRPLHSVVATFDGALIGGAVDLGGSSIKFGCTTSGHRFLDPSEIKVAGFGDYKVKLREGYVIVDPAERRAAIKEQTDKLAAAEGLTVKPDDALLDEVTGLVEWPAALMGHIDEQFMDTPSEVLTTSMRVNQKYFSLLDKNGKLAPRFLVVSNMETKDGGKAIVAGNERVLRARLSDAKFFWDQDRKVKLEERVPALKDIVFHARLGTVADKVSRTQTLAAELVPHIPGADVDQVRSAALLAKADLTTGMVGEFPELQGVMGRYYAMHEGEKQAVADAIAEHYAPLGPNDRCPTAPVSVAVALADKIDSLVGFFAIDEKPTGSKDPFALRRAALGVIRLIVENKLRLPLKRVFAAAHQSYAGEKAVFAPLKSNELLDFFADRLKVALREKGVRHDLISAVFALGGEDDLVRLLARVDALKRFLDSEDGANLLVAYRRASNIVRIEEKKDGKTYNSGVDGMLLRQEEEKALHQALAASGAAGGRALEGEDFTGAMGALAQLRAPVDAFFDKVTVNCDEA
ncbi:MAG: glycine--tRNA ligase subunit beta, partial [Rhodospirillales bacterium]|nr:glycine--tRNA ligase subunit beta [Rhodospirillales bacterium]